MSRSTTPVAAQRVQSLDRAFAILRCFTPSQSELSLSELARLTGLSTSTTHRLLTSLKTNGALRQVGDRRYRLGPLVLQLTNLAIQSSGLRETALPLMRVLRDVTDETVGLHLLRSDLTRSVIEQVESRQALRRIYTEIGNPIGIPLHLGAPGKLLLAYLPERDRYEVLARPLVRATPMTLTDPDQVAATLAEIRGRGYSVSLGERVDGIRSVAAPIREHSGRVIASLSVSGPERRMPQERLHVIAAQARDCATEVSRNLGAPEFTLVTQSLSE
jgi:IclR family transcriptional regulator, acetate operon repressor